MPQKKYIVRDGFVVVLRIKKSEGGFFERSHQGGEEISLDDDTAAEHQHKLEFASQRDRDAALEAERKAAVSSAAAQSPAELVGALIAALTQTQQGAVAATKETA